MGLDRRMERLRMRMLRRLNRKELIEYCRNIEKELSKYKEAEEKEKHKKTTEKLQKLLSEVGIEIGIDFHIYREDADYMTVKYNGEIIHKGTTEDLTKKSRKEIYNKKEDLE